MTTPARLSLDVHAVSMQPIAPQTAAQSAPPPAQVQDAWYQRPTAIDRFVAQTRHPWRVVLPMGPVVGNGIKAGAWNLPLVLLKDGYAYASVAALSGLVAGPEYAATKTALVTAHMHEAQINEHLVATLMFATDNLWRTGVQCAVDKAGVTQWDWVAVGAIIGVACLQGLASYGFKREHPPLLPTPNVTQTTPPRYLKQTIANTALATALAGSTLGVAYSGILQNKGHAVMSGNAYLLSTVATGGKVLAWWMHIQPSVQKLRLNMPAQIVAGWQTAFAVEYWALIGAITLGVRNEISLPLMFGYMVALENVIRLAQFSAAGKATRWYDYGAAAAMTACVVGQGVSHVLT